MKKLLAFLILAGIFPGVLGVHAESNEGSRQYAENYQDFSAEDIPTFEEFGLLPGEEKNEVKQALESLPLDKGEAYLSEEITKFCQIDDKTKLIKVTLSKDNLSVLAGQNRKPVENLVVMADLKLLPSDEIGLNEIAAEYADKLNVYLQKNTYTALLMKEIKIQIFDADEILRNTFNGSYSVVGLVMFKEQPAAEYEAQTQAFDFAKDNPKFVLQKFGMLPETGELYIEFYVKDNYFGKSSEKIKQKTEELSDVYEKVKEKVLSEKAVKAYMQENQLDSHTVVFNSGMLDEEYVTFHAENE